MNLETLVPHKYGTKLLVNGEVYQIDDEGVLRDVPAEVAEKLLMNASWREHDGTSAKKPMAGGSRPKVALVGVDGSKHEKPEDTPPAETGGSDAPPPPVDDPPIPDEGGEWADPSVEYSMEWLKACADAYEVKYPKNIGAEKLVEKIKAAMYE